MIHQKTAIASKLSPPRVWRLECIAKLREQEKKIATMHIYPVSLTYFFLQILINFLIKFRAQKKEDGERMQENGLLQST